MRFIIGIVVALCPAFAFAQGSVLLNYRASTGGTREVSSVYPLPVTQNTNVASYAAADVDIQNTGAGDIWCIAGSATRTVYLTKIHVSGTASAALVTNVSIIKRSALGSGGTPINETEVPMDSSNAAATATVTGYSTSPTSGAAVGTIEAHKVAIGTQGNTAQATEAFFEYGVSGTQPIVLRGAAQNVCVNVSAAGSGGSWAVYTEWYERP